jgi:hypothetical protein
MIRIPEEDFAVGENHTDGRFVFGRDRKRTDACIFDQTKRIRVEDQIVGKINDEIVQRA